MAGRLVIAFNIHVPFYIASGAIALGIVVLATAHRLLSDAERVQAEQIAATPRPRGRQTVPAGGPATAMIPVRARRRSPGPVPARA